MRQFKSRFRSLAMIITAAAATAVPFNMATAQTTPSDSLAQLQTELDAVDTMTDTLGPMRKSAELRLQQMKDFIEQTGKSSDWQKWTAANPGDAFHGLSFQQALTQAAKQQKSRGASKPSTDDRDLLAREVSAQQTMTQDQWNTVNKLHEEVQQRTNFIRSIKGMRDYEKFAADETKKRLANHTPPAATTDRRSESGGISPAQRQANIEKYQNQQATLRKHWDNYHFTFATTGGPPPGGPFGNRNDNNNNDNYNDNYNDNDYYDGSYHNGYADPYYDVWGRRHRVHPNERDRDGDQLHQGYDRGSNPNAPIAPQSDHPSSGPAWPSAGAFPKAPAERGPGRR
jgi:hypothetical protein